ncbi:MAG: hypothetical protein ACK42Z_01485 [Candidatus Kapaibacteriota bacterium]
MGWYDTCKLVFIQIASILIFQLNIISQEKGEIKFPPAYQLKAYFKTQTFYNYVLYDTTEVHRTYADSSKKHFKRIINYFMTLVQRDDPKDGFAKVEIYIDSITYKFVENDKVYEFVNIESSNPNIFKFEDFQTYIVPMSMQFEIIYSPYGEVAKIEGERLLEKRSYVEKLRPTLPDTLWYYNWNDGLSDQRLKHIGDVIKLIYPPHPIFRDSLWRSPIELLIDGINLIDTVELKATGFFNNQYQIVGRFVNPSIIWKRTKFYDIKSLHLPYELKDVVGSIQQSLSATGIVKELKIILNLDLDIGLPIAFTENISKSLRWEMIKSYRF